MWPTQHAYQEEKAKPREENERTTSDTISNLESANYHHQDL